MRQGVPRATSSGHRHRALSITHAVVGRGASFFFMAEYDSAAWAGRTRTPPRAPAGGRLAQCASERAAVAGARIPGSSGYLRRSGIAGRFATLNLRSCQTVLHASCRLASPPAGREGPAFLPPLAPARLLDAGPRGDAGARGLTCVSPVGGRPSISSGLVAAGESSAERGPLPPLACSGAHVSLWPSRGLHVSRTLGACQTAIRRHFSRQRFSPLSIVPADAHSFLILTDSSFSLFPLSIAGVLGVTSRGPLPKPSL